MKYLIIGAGGAGGLIGGFLARSNFDVTLVARGKHLAAIQEKGLIINRYNKEKITIPNVKAVSQTGLGQERFAIVFVCVKAYSIKEIIPVLEKVADAQTIIIPILNSMETGNILRAALPSKSICDGCIYITGYVSAPGEITQNNQIFRIVYGFANQSKANYPILKTLESDLRISNIEVQYSSDIFSQIFKKLAFTSAFASVGGYYHVKAKAIQQIPAYREVFIRLLRELEQIGRAANYTTSAEIVENNTAILDHLTGEFTTSFQKDLAANKPDEREELIFAMVRLAQKYQVPAPTYLKIAKHFGYIG
ncbi:ketopantoate reductase family protein [Adhaeribacter radiodurans]|uniref:2-dehydropantoate 2-reductase n=1 Tax=Adhaeribacter radiodurans TaxID=2745197 RepID=A0A7L7L1L9_9BACT|nr:2-dehydropantoate 2-reductase [Adhaeribacter radiodurans]QMU26683.1 2-dehydropantoate 2-reductase [Adhaeribacter radiodurans]